MKIVPVFFLLLILQLFSSVALASFQVTQNQQQILYVKRGNDSRCPTDVQFTECQTLDWYGEHFNVSFTINVKMLFEEGVHVLKNTIIIDNCHSFIAIGNGDAGKFKDGLPQPTSKIYCDKESSAGFFFSNSTNVTMKNLQFKFCSGQNTHHTWSNISASLMFDSVQHVSLDQVVISSAKGHALYASNIFGSNYVVESAFLNSSRHQNFSQSGNAKFNFSTTHSFTSLVLNSSWFMYGETLLEQSAAGLVIEIFCPNIYVTLNNVTAKGNNGGLGGNIAIFLIISKANSSSTVINNSRIMDGHALKGGGLVFISRQSHMHTMKYPTIIENHSFDLGILTICDTIFHNNSAIISGGAMYMAHHSYDTTISYLKHITITNCIFAENGGKGSSIDILQVSLQPRHHF